MIGHGLEGPHGPQVRVVNANPATDTAATMPTAHAVRTAQFITQF
jgi:hypothetical protein